MKQGFAVRERDFCCVSSERALERGGKPQARAQHLGAHHRDQCLDIGIAVPRALVLTQCRAAGGTMLRGGIGDIARQLPSLTRPVLDSAAVTAARSSGE